MTKKGWWLAGGLILLAATLAPAAWGQPAEPPQGCPPGIQGEKLIKELNLSPEKAQAFMGLCGKYDKIRREIREAMTAHEEALAKVLAAAQPDEAKVKELVAAIAQDHERLFDTFKAQRREEMALLTTVQQGKFILVLKKWHDDMRKP